MSRGDYPALPVTLAQGEAYYHGHKQYDGLRIREYYAAHAPIGMEDAHVSLNLQNELGGKEGREFPPHMIMAELVRLRWEYADRMVEAGGV